MSIPGYTGETRSIRHGQGKYTFEDGRVYEGRWNNDVIEGHGKMTWPKKAWLKDVHDGIIDDHDGFVRNLPYSYDYGTPAYDLGGWDPNDEGFSCEYEGEWKDGMKHGQGIFKVYDDGTTTTYEGQWNKDIVDGAGTIRNTYDIEPNEHSTFQGHFKLGLRHGQGTEIVETGGEGILENESIGNWKDGEFWRGKIKTLVDYDPVSYINITVEHANANLFKCVATMPDGIVYSYSYKKPPYKIGQQYFRPEFYNGEPKITYPSGLSYEGPWDKELKRHGKGTFKMVGGKDFDVEFHHGKLITKVLPFAISLDECNGDTICPIMHDDFKEGRIVKFRNRCYSVEALAYLHQNNIRRDPFTRQDFKEKDLQLLELADGWVKSNPAARTNTRKRSRPLSNLTKKRRVKSL